MANRWTLDDDAFLLAYLEDGADVVAARDLGRPIGAGSRRLKKLRGSGAHQAWTEMRLAWIRFEAAAGHRPGGISGLDEDCEYLNLEKQLSKLIGEAALREQA